MSDLYLQHYGALGMKLGVRKDPERAYSKAGAKLEKLDTKTSNLSAKGAKREQKAAAKQRKASSAIFFQKSRARRASNATREALKTYQKAREKQFKAYRWNEEMTKAFKNVKVKNMAPKYVSLGEKYSKTTIDQIMQNNVSVNALMNMGSSLQHYGILGMKWGVKRGPPYPVGSPNNAFRELMQKSYFSHLSEWGALKDNNVCFVMGYSGSGKSTIAQGLKSESTDVLHLDLYVQPGLSSADTEERSSEFNQFLAKNNIPFPSDVSLNNWKRLNILSRFEKAIEDFGRAQYDKDRRVIAEGVELLDSTLFPDKSYFNDKPLIITGTNSIESMRRAFARDGRGGLIKGLAGLDSAISYISWYRQMHQSIQSIKKSSSAKRGAKVIDEILRQIGNENPK